ncbi:MAG: element excision factor XisH family protein [Chloroflexota bacterium]
MPAKDKIHDNVRNALKNDGWQVIKEQMRVQFEDAYIYVDLAAEDRLVVAERAGERVAIEVKSFLSPSAMQDIEDALGQFVVYRIFLKRIEPDRHLFLGISHLTYNTVFQSRAIQTLIDELAVSLLIVNIETEEVLDWIRK